MGRLNDFIAELKRRRVFRALIGWGIASFAVLQVIEPVMHGFDLPDWTLKVVILCLVAGFPIAAALSWAFDLTTKGVTRTAPAGDGNPAQARPRLALLLVGLGLLAAAPGVVYLFVWPRLGQSPSNAKADGPPSVAVLPFADMSASKDQEYLADGIAEEILNALAHVDGLRVPARTSSFWFKGKNAKLSEIGKELAVRSVLEGSVRRDGGRIRVSAQLVDARNGYHLWSETFDRDLTDIFKVQEEISRAVAAALQVKLMGKAADATPKRQPRIEAYEQYLIGRQLLNAGTPASVPAARDAFARAVALDPAYAAAHAGLAFAHGDIAGFLAETPEEFKAESLLQIGSAERAIALDPSLPDGYLARADHKLGYLRDWSGALADVERARSLGPGAWDAASVTVRALVAMGRVPEATAAARSVTVADPLSARGWGRLSNVLTISGDPVGAEAAARRALQIAPDSSGAMSSLADSLIGQRRFEEARQVLERNPYPYMRLMGLACTLHFLGRARESQAALDELVARHSLQAGYQIACAHACRGESDQAFEWLERARVQLDPGLEDARNDFYLTNLRGDPRWKPFLRKLNFPVD